MSTNIKIEPEDSAEKRINVRVPPGKDLLNVKILLDFNSKDAYMNDYKEIVRTFAPYRNKTVKEGGWRGVMVSSPEFLRGLNIGSHQTIRVKEASTQTGDDAVDFCPSPSVFSKEFARM